MRLSRIKLAGFKSFVDPTTIELNTDLTCIVGPNGCGKSNVIDAVRWVMGESSAKQLRGGEMTDVIFNGSSTRKPVGQASVELVFDNSDGTLGGEYAAFTEISVKRVINREAQSTYYLNGVRCRRRDITHIFLGTGLGPRSYAIIEQGMISKLIEAKPDELRKYLEETAGISKYKDRRRETENRMRHTRDNLDRLNDLREELRKQREKLQRQAKSAEQFKVLREEERLLDAQLQAINWQGLDKKAKDQQAALAQAEAHAESFKAETTRIDTGIEQARIEHDEQNSDLQQAQNNFYSIGSEAARLEQDLKHALERRSQLTEEHTQVMQHLGELQSELQNDAESTEQLQRRMSDIAPEEDKLREEKFAATEALNRAELELAKWQKAWDEFKQEVHAVSQSAHGEQTTVTHLEENVLKAKQRLERQQQQLRDTDISRLQQRLDEIKTLRSKLEQAHMQASETLAQVQSRIASTRSQNDTLEDELDNAKDALQDSKAEQLSLQALQNAALNVEDEAANNWLQEKSLAEKQRLAQTMQVSPGYEKAIEIVLGDYLQAICVDNIDEISAWLQDLDTGVLAFLQNTPFADVSLQQTHSLMSKVKSSATDLSHLLSPVMVADDLQIALNIHRQLRPGESVITRDGIWLGENWVRVARKETGEGSILAREQRLNELKAVIAEQQEQVSELAQQLQQGRDVLDDLELERSDAQREQNELHRKLAEARANQQTIEREQAAAQEQAQQLQAEVTELQQQIQYDNDAIRQTRQNLEQHLKQMAAFEDTKQSREAEKQQIERNYQTAKETAKEKSEHYAKLQIEVSTINSQLEAAVKNNERMTQQLHKLKEREQWLTQQLEEVQAPLAKQQADLEEKLKLRSEADKHLQKMRETVDSIAHSMRELERSRQEFDQKLQEAQTKANELRLGMEEVRVRRATIEEHMAETEFNLQTVANELPEEANAREWGENLERIRTRINRLGPINLAAIEEYDATHERQEYLDAQHADLSQALDSLEGAIAKIDQETRERFKATFNKVNENLSQLFPSVFNGGNASLALVGDSILDAGVAIMAQPPGKKNSAISMLSGGEKALTALALVFSLFKLTPAPFCMLDEVDAPLDDVNVGRYCGLVKEMAKSLQFIFITHNKLSMEMASQMMGVTMREPGASRVVSVDINEAVAMVEE
jgi:chromosome segregation protein